SYHSLSAPADIPNAPARCLIPDRVNRVAASPGASRTPLPPPSISIPHHVRLAPTPGSTIPKSPCPPSPASQDERQSFPPGLRYLPESIESLPARGCRDRALRAPS